MNLNLHQKPQIFVFLSVAMLLLCIFFAPCSAMAEVFVNNGYIIKPLTKGAVTAAYVEFYNKGNNEAKLVRVTSDKAKSIEIHDHQRGNNGEVRMVKLDSLPIPANGKVALKQGGLHLMIYGLSDNIKIGDKLSITFFFDNKTSVTKEFDVKALE